MAKTSSRKFLKNSKSLKTLNVPVNLEKSLDWDSPSSFTGTIKKRPSPTAIKTKVIPSQTEVETTAIKSFVKIQPKNKIKIVKTKQDLHEKQETVLVKNNLKVNNVPENDNDRIDIHDNDDIYDNITTVSSVENEFSMKSNSSLEIILDSDLNLIKNNQYANIVIENVFYNNTNAINARDSLNCDQTIMDVELKCEETPFKISTKSTPLQKKTIHNHHTIPLKQHQTISIQPQSTPLHYNFHKPPTPPPISHIPSLNKNHLQKLNDEKKPIISGNDLEKAKEKNHSYNNNNDNNNNSNNYRSKSYTSPSNKGLHLSELKNCISKLNSKFSITSALSKAVHFTQLETNEIKKFNSPIHLDKQHEKSKINENEYILSSEQLKISPDDMKILSKPKFTSSQLKNIPVRPRKGPKISHLENYYLFDPNVDFINEKDQKSTIELDSIKKALQEIPMKEQEQQQQSNYNILEQIFNDQVNHFDDNILNKNLINEVHHNYFTIDPEIFETISTASDTSIELSSSTNANSNLKSMHVQNQFNSYENCRQSTSTIPNTATVVNFNNKYSCIEIMVNKNVSLKVQENEQQQKEQQLKLLKQKQKQSNYSSSNTNTIVTKLEQSQQNVIQPMASNKMISTKEREQNYQQHNIPLDILIPNNGKGQQYNHKKFKDINSYYNNDNHQQPHLHSDYSYLHHTYPQYSNNHQNLKFFSADSTLIGLKNSKINPKPLQQIIKLEKKDDIKPENAKCLPIVKSNEYYNEHSNNTKHIHAKKEILKIRRHSMDEIYLNSHPLISSHSNINYYRSSRTLPIKSKYRKFENSVIIQGQKSSSIQHNTNAVINNRNILQGGSSSYECCNKIINRLSSSSEDIDSVFLSSNCTTKDKLEFNSDIFWEKILLMKQSKNIQGYIEVFYV
ncbi:protein kinase 4-like [Condylostylus longicornis]|uniref:protein kinase 4-like n=1 Tax=Condylostylus longicornis TaxID=2530218 RepID=UPI00244DACE1|nr:protein kinase 4-like [Condylostylus longicornis]